MGDDVFSAFGRGFAGFAHSRAGRLTGESFSDAGSLVASLFDGTDGSTKAAFKELKQQIDALSPLIEQLKKALDADIAEGKAAVAEMAAELAQPEFEADELARFLSALAKLLVAYDRAIGKCAETLAAQEPPAQRAQRAEQIRSEINGTHAPIKRVFSNLGQGTLSNFNKLCKLVLGVDQASDELAERMEWSYAEKRLSVTFATLGPVGGPPLSFDGGHLEAFFQYKEDLRAGIELSTHLRAGLRSDKLLEKIIPQQGPTADAQDVAVTLDTTRGLTFGAGPNKRLVLPVRLSLPGVELRELAIEQPAQDNPKGKNRVNVVFTVAGKLGDTFAAVVEGGGVSIRWVDGGEPEIKPKIPTGAGLRLKTGLVSGGGYLRYDEVKEEYGGVFQLEIAKVGATAFGLIGTKPFSFAVVIGVRFPVKIELGFGFTLNGLGGILALERTLDSLALVNGLKHDIVGQLLFPSDPVAVAPQILNQLGAVFPQRSGGVVVGPIAELGWGSQTGFVRARLGMVLCLPDPKVVVLGALEVAVPSPDVAPKLRLVDIHADLLGEITPDYFFIKVSLAPSKLFKLTLSGDLAIYVQWEGDGAFALSVGGFFPDYAYPKLLGSMDRVAIKFASPVDWLSVAVTAYFAITSNTVQFGGRLELKAEVGPAKAEGWLQIDALFQWAPYFAFETRLDVGIRVTAFGVTLAGVRFTGKLRGDTPWYLEGNATCEILFWDVEVPIGPLEWGEKPPQPLPVLDVVKQVAAALREDRAWTPVLPAGAAQIVRLTSDLDGSLYHPLGELEARQLRIPLEYQIDRVGSASVSTPRVNLTKPALGGVPAGAVWPTTDRFSPGHYLDLSDDAVMGRPEFELLQSGLGLSSARGALFSACDHAAYAWNTVFPNRPDPERTMDWKLGKLAKRALSSNAVSQARAVRDNPFMLDAAGEQAELLHERGLVDVLRADTLESVTAGAYVTAGEAGRMRSAARASTKLTTLDPGMVP